MHSNSVLGNVAHPPVPPSSTRTCDVCGAEYKSRWGGKVTCGNCKLALTTLHLPEVYLAGIDALVQRGELRNRSDVIRVALRRLLDREVR